MMLPPPAYAAISVPEQGPPAMQLVKVTLPDMATVSLLAVPPPAAKLTSAPPNRLTATMPDTVDDGTTISTTWAPVATIRSHPVDIASKLHERGAELK